MFNEGGLNQEGGMVDEVSGNEVPMGSTREEVRDDIPAQVSEGEFIFPADVVRFIGLNQLMQMRQDAKMGLKKMDAMGQMGNSDEATMPDDMPFGIADLVVIDGPDEEEPQKKYKGGLSFANGGISMPDFDRSSQDVRIYVKEGSPDRRVPFFNGEPVISIENLLAQGYVLKGSEPVEETETEEAIPTRKSSDRTPMKKTPFQEAGGWGMELGDPPDPAKVKLWTDEYAKTSGNTPAVLTGIATVLGGPLGALVHMANKGNAKSAAANYERVMKAAQQTNVAGQVKALQDINKAVKEGGDKSLLGKLIDGLKDTFGLSTEQADKAKTTATQASTTIATAKPLADNLDIENVVAGESNIANAAAKKAREDAAASAAAASETEKAIPFDAEGVVANERDFESKGTSPVRLMGDSETEKAIPFDAESVVASESNAANSDTDAAPEADAAQIAVDAAQTSSLPPEIQLKISQREKADKQYMDVYRQPFNDFGNPGDAELLLELDNRMRYASTDAEKRKLDQMFEDVVIRQIDDQDNKLRVAKDLQIQTKNTIDPAAFASINISTPQTVEQIGAEIGVDFSEANILRLPAGFKEMFEQASQGTVDINAKTVADLRNRLLSDAEIEANTNAAIKSRTAADLVNETALSNREKTSERSGQLSAEELMSPDKSPTSSGSGRSLSSSGPRKPSLAQRMQETRKAGQSAQKSLDKYKDSDEAKKIAQTGSQEQIKALERTSDVVRDMQRGVQRGFKKGGLASRRK